MAEADDWAFAYQLGAGLLIALSDHVEFCGGEYCSPVFAPEGLIGSWNIPET
jgi:hypothetical protein